MKGATETSTPRESAKDPIFERLVETTRRRGFEAVACRLEHLGEWLTQDLEPIERFLAGAAEGQADLARLTAGHLLLRPGERVRSLCVILAARLGDRPATRERIRDLASAAELVHAATLLHDDVMDEAPERSGAAAARVLYGNSASVLGGDHLLVEALRRVDRSGSAELRRGLHDVIASMISAEALQLQRRGVAMGALIAAGSPAQARAALEAHYLQVVRGRTAALFCWALAAGAECAGLPSRLTEALVRAGEGIGVAVQLIDDRLDLMGDPLETGKDSLRDLAEGKATWPLVHALEHDRGLGEELVRYLSGESGALTREALAQRVSATGAAEATDLEAQRYADEALRALEPLADRPAHRAFTALVAALHQRQARAPAANTSSPSPVCW